MVVINFSFSLIPVARFCWVKGTAVVRIVQRKLTGLCDQKKKKKDKEVLIKKRRSHIVMCAYCTAL